MSSRRARLSRLARQSLVDGCLGEEVGARTLLDCGMACADPDLRQALLWRLGTLLCFGRPDSLKERSHRERVFESCVPRLSEVPG